MAHTIGELNTILDRPMGDRPIAVIHAIEGAHSLDGRDPSNREMVENLEILFRRGVVSITLAHFCPNRVVHPRYPFPEEVARLRFHPNLWPDVTLALTDLGKQDVERMIELGRLIDLSH